MIALHTVLGTIKQRRNISGGGLAVITGAQTEAYTGKTPFVTQSI